MSSKRFLFKKASSTKDFKIGFDDILAGVRAKNGSGSSGSFGTQMRSVGGVPSASGADPLGDISLDSSTRDIYSEIGLMLREARKKNGVKLEEIAELSKVRMEYLQMIEDGLFEDVSRLTYYPGCVRVMAKMSGLDADEVLLQLSSYDPHLETIINSSNTSYANANNKVNANQKALTARKRDAVRKDMAILFAVIVGLLLVVGWTKGDNTANVGNKFLEEVATVTKN